MLVLRAASATACTAVNGGATTISTASSTPLTRFFNSLTKTTASATVLYIFQLPATKGMRISELSRQGGRGGQGIAVRHSCLSVRPAYAAYPVRSALSESAATPGSVRPPRNSSDAPPPVEMCVI